VVSNYLGGEQGNNTAIGKVIGPAFYANEIPAVITSLINTYVEKRWADESFIQTYRRLGPTPFKEAAYLHQGRRNKDKTEAFEASDISDAAKPVTAELI
jgi:sulfite reductase (NADPH) hemoprotein beta-component